MKKTFAFFLCLCIFACIFCGCSKQSDQYKGGELSYEEGTLTDSAELTDQSGKIIYSANISAQTKDFTLALENIETDISNANGYISDSRISGGEDISDDSKRSRNAVLTIRVPKDHFESLIRRIDESFNITQKSISSNDVTRQYIDYESQLNNLINQEQRLNELMKNAQDLDQILSIENQITSVRTRIDTLQSDFDLLKNQIDYSTICLSVSEVQEFSQGAESFRSRLKNAFIDSWIGFGDLILSLVIFFVSAFPALLLLAAILFIILFFVRRARKKRRRAGAENENFQNPPIQNFANQNDPKN